MAEGWARLLQGEVIEPYSAGIVAHGQNPNAIRVMAEVGVDISRQQSKSLDTLKDRHFDCVITVCAHADENCPAFAGTTRIIHAGFDDPPTLARNARTEEEALGHYRRVRDEIRDYINSLPEVLNAL